MPRPKIVEPPWLPHTRHKPDHAESHAHDGADGSGTVAHGDTTGQTTDDHHAKSHGHTGADGSGTVAHSATTGKTANDHHNEDHKARHITGGADEIDGDQLDVDWNPSNYTPATTPSEVSSVDHLTAHLYGIDQALGSAGVSISTPTVNLVDSGSLTMGTGNSQNAIKITLGDFVILMLFWRFGTSPSGNSGALNFTLPDSDQAHTDYDWNNNSGDNIGHGIFYDSSPGDRTALGMFLANQTTVRLSHAQGSSNTYTFSGLGIASSDIISATIMYRKAA